MNQEDKKLNDFLLQENIILNEESDKFDKLLDELKKIFEISTILKELQVEQLAIDIIRLKRVYLAESQIINEQLKDGRNYGEIFSLQLTKYGIFDKLREYELSLKKDIAKTISQL